MDLQTLNEDEFATLHPSVKKYLTAWDRDWETITP